MGLCCSLVQQGGCTGWGCDGAEVVYTRDGFVLQSGSTGCVYMVGDVRCEVVYTRGGFALQPAAWFCHVAVYARLEI